ncbi:MAG: hypothetical protein AB1401_10370 [Thermodesulfobacteriota bacterium]
MIIRILAVCFILLLCVTDFGYTEEPFVDVLIEGYDDGVKSTVRNDREEALVDAKRQAIERAGVQVSSTTQMKNFVIRKDWVESKSKGILLPGFQIIDKGYQANGSYLVILAGRIRPILTGASVSHDEGSKKPVQGDLDSIYNEVNWEVLLGGWEFKNNSITSKYTSDDNYLILKKELKDYIMEATITKIRGDFCYITIGIRQNIFEGGHEKFFRNNTSSRQGYQFGIILDGRYNLFNGLNGLYYTVENVKGLFKKNWETSPLIDSIQNKVKIEAIEDIIKISLNGKDFAEFKNNSHLYGSPMFIVSKNAVIRFTDIKIIPR